MASLDTFGAKTQLRVGDASYEIFKINKVDGHDRLPYSLKILLENLLRNEDGANIAAEHIRQLGAWDPAADPSAAQAARPRNWRHSSTCIAAGFTHTSTVGRRVVRTFTSVARAIFERRDRRPILPVCPFDGVARTDARTAAATGRATSASSRRSLSLISFSRRRRRSAARSRTCRAPPIVISRAPGIGQAAAGTVRFSTGSRVIEKEISIVIASSSRLRDLPWLLTRTG